MVNYIRDSRIRNYFIINQRSESAVTSYPYVENENHCNSIKKLLGPLSIKVYRITSIADNKL